MSPYDPKQVSAFQGAAAYSVAARTGLVAAVLDTWDGALLREPRICVPVDVQALVVPRPAPGVDDGETAGVPLIGPLSPGAA
ncbi:hypothetical protein, partial [Angustibacter aerolatus]